MLIEVFYQSPGDLQGPVKAELKNMQDDGMGEVCITDKAFLERRALTREDSYRVKAVPYVGQVLRLDQYAWRPQNLSGTVKEMWEVTHGTPNRGHDHSLVSKHRMMKWLVDVIKLQEAQDGRGQEGVGDPGSAE